MVLKSQKLSFFGIFLGEGVWFFHFSLSFRVVLDGLAAAFAYLNVWMFYFHCRTTKNVLYVRWQKLHSDLVCFPPQSGNMVYGLSSRLFIREGFALLWGLRCVRGWEMKSALAYILYLTPGYSSNVAQSVTSWSASVSSVFIFSSLLGL